MVGRSKTATGTTLVISCEQTLYLLSLPTIVFPNYGNKKPQVFRDAVLLVCCGVFELRKVGSLQALMSGVPSRHDKNRHGENPRVASVSYAVGVNSMTSGKEKQ